MKKILIKSTIAIVLLLCYGQMAVAQHNRIWGTYYGSPVFDGFSNSTVDFKGNVYACGTTYSATDISHNGFQNTYGGGTTDAFLVKFDSLGNRLWATYYGGTGNDNSRQVTTDKDGNVYIIGQTVSPNNIAYLGFQNTIGGKEDGFMVKFDSLGNRLWATYFGGSEADGVNDIVVDDEGNIFITGDTKSSSGITTNGVYQNGYTGIRNSFIAKFSATGNRIWGTYTNGQSESITVDFQNNIYIAGTSMQNEIIASSSNSFQTVFGGLFDAFLMKFDTTGNKLWGTYYGGSDYDWGAEVAADYIGNIYLGGNTVSVENIAFQGHQNSFGGGSQDAFVAKFDSFGNRLLGSYFGGSESETLYDLVVDLDNNFYLAGSTLSSTAIYLNGFQDTALVNSNHAAGFLSKFDADGKLECSTYCGAMDENFTGGTSISGIAIYDTVIYVAGGTNNTLGIAYNGFQNVAPGGQNDGFLVKYSKFQNTELTATFELANVACSGQCSGSATIKPKGGTGNYSYTWNTNPIQTTPTATNLCVGTYMFTVSDGNDTIQQTVEIIATTTLSVDVLASPSEICLGDTSQLLASGAMSYSWLTNATLSSDTGSQVNAFPTVTTSYTLIGISGECRDTIQKTITVNEAVKLSLNAVSDSICIGNSTAMTASGAQQYSWSPSSNLSSSSGSTVTANPNETTIYRLIGSNGGCSDTLYQTLTVNPLPLISITKDQPIEIGNSITLSASGGLKYLWTPAATLSCSDCSSPVASPLFTTDYCVDVTNLNNCVNNECVTIFVNNNCGVLFIPNSFSPNDDNINDKLEVKINAACVSDYSFMIFDRWGEKVFETTKITDSWDGTFNGKDLDNAVFVYTLKIKLVDSSEFIYKKGNVSILK